MAAIGNSSESDSNSDLAPGKGLSPHFFIGVSLVIGFTLMFVVDQIGSYCSIHGKATHIANKVTHRSESCYIVFLLVCSVDFFSLALLLFVILIYCI